MFIKFDEKIVNTDNISNIELAEYPYCDCHKEYNCMVIYCNLIDGKILAEKFHRINSMTAEIVFEHLFSILEK